MYLTVNERWIKGKRGGYMYNHGGAVAKKRYAFNTAMCDSWAACVVLDKICG